MKKFLLILIIFPSLAFAGSDDAAKTLYHIYSSGLYGEKKSLCISDFWLALVSKKDTLSLNLLEAKISNCRSGDKITVLE